MIRRNTEQRRRYTAVTARLVVLAVALAIAAGCGDDNDGGRRTPTAVATSTATRPPASSTPAATVTATPPSADASAACTKLVGCKQCLSNFFGSCLSTSDCAARLSADTAICINAVSGCDQTALGDCLFLGCDGSDASGECS